MESWISNQLLQELMLNIQHRQTVITRGKCKRSNTRKNIRCENLPNQSTGIQATRFKISTLPTLSIKQQYVLNVKVGPGS